MNDTATLPAEQQTRAVGAVSSAALEKMQKAKHKDTFAAGELFLPWLQRVQTSSGYMKKNNPEYLKEASEGDIIDNLTKRLRSTQAVIFVKFEMHYTTFAPGGGKVVKQWFTDRSGYDAASFPEGKNYGSKIDEEGNEVAETPTYYILMVDPVSGTAQPATMAWGSTQAKKVKKVNSLAREELFGSDGPFIPPIYSRIFDIGTTIESGNDKSWAGWTYKVGDLVLANEKFGEMWYAKAEAFREQIELGNVRPAPPVEADSVDDTGGEPRRPARRDTSQATDAPDLDEKDIPF